mgnify:CR=1 FL=1
MNNIEEKEKELEELKVIRWRAVISYTVFPIVGLICLILVLTGVKQGVNTFATQYGKEFVPRRCVTTAIDEVNYAIECDEMSDLEKLEYIKQTMEILNQETDTNADKTE